MSKKQKKREKTNGRLSGKRQLARYAAAVALSFLLTAVLVQFVPPFFIGEVQAEFFLLWPLTALLLCLLNLWLPAQWRRVVLGLSAVSLLFPLFVGWGYPMLFQSVCQYFTHARNRISSRVEIKLAEGVASPHISLQQRIQQKVDYTNPEVRRFAVRNSLLYFDDYYSKYGQICRQFSLIKSIKEQYKYVKDPKGFDYFADPTESIALMAGDCDDHSILMASVLEAIGASVRIVWAPGHVYPELFCGDQNSFDRYVSAVYALFKEEIGEKRIYYRLDKNGDYWMNIDYTDSYPGSVYYCEEVLSIIYIK
ncbi:MAG: hypothetical protein J5873_01190 [Bacteroidales bacterium]|nr:hypothetical protein [Bacteroidales bacterium]